MVQVQFTLDFEKMTDAILQSNLETAMKGLTVAVFNAYMEMERNQFIQAQAYERGEHRTDQRNGYYERDLTLSIGKITLKVPRTRSGEFKTALFERYQRCERALIATMVEMVVQGVSTRKITQVVEQLCGESVSKSCVSDMMKQLDPEIEAFQNRSLTGKSFDYVSLDALYIRVHEQGRSVDKALYLATGILNTRKREVLGFTVNDVESTLTWETFLRSLRTRGLQNPKLITSDAHPGIKAAVQTVFEGVPWQRCTYHFLKNLTDKLPKHTAEECSVMLREIFQAPTRQHALELKQHFVEQFESTVKLDKVLSALESGFEDATQYVHEPFIMHKFIRTTSHLERLNRELRRRDQVICTYPNTASATRLLGSVILDIHEKWEAQRPFNL